MVTFKPRPKQAEVLKFRKGRMGVSAVPGSGKTRTLSYLAANLVADGRLKDDQEVLQKAMEHAREHGIRQVTPELEAKVKAAIREEASRA